MSSWFLTPQPALVNHLPTIVGVKEQRGISLRS
jgi:hypothetical protein